MPSHIYHDPTLYSRNNLLQYNFAMSLFNQITFQEHSRILDIGCGDGKITTELAKRARRGSVIGTDISFEMTEYASKTYADVANLKFIQMDASDNIFYDQFEVITSFNCLHWLHDQLAALQGIAKAATDAAQIVLLLSHRKSIYHHVIKELCTMPRWHLYFQNYQSPRNFFTVDEYKVLLQTAGLEIEQIVEEEMIYPLCDRNAIEQFFYSSGSQINKVPKKFQQEFLNNFSSIFLEMSNLSFNDEILLGFWCLKILARKEKQA